MLVNINDIKIKKRVRRDLGDLEALKNSLRTYGLLNPITINGKYELIAGERRLQAAKQLVAQIQKLAGEFHVSHDEAIMEEIGQISNQILEEL